MEQYIPKAAIVAEIKRIMAEEMSLFKECCKDGLDNTCSVVVYTRMKMLLSFLDTLEVKDPYKWCVQYDSIKAGIQAHAETYSFNIESMLFNQLTKEQQELWRTEIEQAVISGGEVGVELARDPRYNNVDTKK